MSLQMCEACLRNAGDFMAPVVKTVAGSEYLRSLNSKQINNPYSQVNAFPDVYI